MKKLIILLISIMIVCLGMLSGCTINKNTNENNNDKISGVSLAPDAPDSPIRKYFTMKKIIWTFDDYWIHFENHPPHKGFDGLSQQIHNYGGHVNILCPFIPSWIDEHYNYEIRNYSVVNEFVPLHTGFLQNHINLSLEFFNRSYITVAAHSWNHSSENLNYASLSYAYKIINYTLWNWYNNYHIKPNFWLGKGSTGNYNISLALKRFSDTYWTVYAEDFTGLNSKGKFLDGNSPAVEYIGNSCDPLFGCDFGDPCKTLEEAQQLFTDYSLGKEIIFLRGHPSILNDTSHLNDLYLWQEWINWVYQNHTLININHTQAIEYKIDRNNFVVTRNNGENYTINLTLCQFNHNVLFTPPDNNGTRWILHNENGKVIGEIQRDVFLSLEKGHCYYFTRLTNT